MLAKCFPCLFEAKVPMANRSRSINSTFDLANLAKDKPALQSESKASPVEAQSLTVHLKDLAPKLPDSLQSTNQNRNETPIYQTDIQPLAAIPKRRMLSEPETPQKGKLSPKMEAKANQIRIALKSEV